MDTETTPIGVFPVKLHCIGVFNPNTNQSYLMFNTDDAQSLFDKYDVVFHNAAYDVNVLRQLGLKIDIHHVHDTMLMSYCIRPDGTHSLTGLCDYYDVAHKKTSHEDFSEYTNEMGDYCLNDCVATWEVYEHLIELLPQVNQIYIIERNFIDCIIELNNNGVHIDDTVWRDTLAVTQGTLDAIDYDILKLVPLVPSKKVVTKNPRNADTVCDLGDLTLGKFVFVEESDSKFTYAKVEEFNPSSADHVAWALRVLYNWEPTSFSDKTGKPTVDKETLSELNYPLAKLLTQRSDLNKILTTYGESLLEKVREGRLYGSFNQTVTKTGRLSSSSPNLQNIPSKGEVGSVIRNSFVAPEGKLLVGCDVDAFQLRILSWYLHHCLGDKLNDANALFDNFNTSENPDPHQAKADLLGITRKEGKTLNFAVLFGAGTNKIAGMLGKSLKETKELLNKDKELNPSISTLQEMTVNGCKYLKGQVFDLYGRRGYYPDILSTSREKSSGAARQAFNFIIQSTEATIVKLWLTMCLNDVQAALLDAKLILQVHDECLWEVSPSDADDLCLILQSRLQDTGFLPGLKLTGTPVIGKSWGETHG